MIHRSRFTRYLLLGTILSMASVAHAQVAVKTITIVGNQRLEVDTIKTYLGVKSGDTPTQYDLDAGLKKLYATGFFSDVSIAQDAGVVTVTVVENASINEVLFEGNSKIDKDALEKEITLKSRSLYTRTKVQKDLKRLLDVYRRSGYYSSEITPQVIQLPQNRVNLVYSITEGPKAFIEKIAFIGNESYPAKSLETIINSSRERWYQFLSDSDKYDPDRLQYDQELLRKFYFENGYADFKVKSAIAELSPQRDAFYITFTIEEGEQYRLGTIDVNTKLPKSRVPELAPSITTQQGDIYNATEVEDSINRMTDVLGDSGFAFVEIKPEITRREGKEKIIDLTYAISEGPKVYVDRINIFGNVRTIDEVIRREFKLSEGDAFSTSKLKRTEQRLNNLGYFEKVSIERKPGSAADKTQLDVQVQEKSTGEITFGAGFSTADGPIADFGVRERNFLGHGQDLRFKAQVGGRRQQYDLGITEPYFLGRELEAGVDLFKSQQNIQNNASFDRATVGGRLRLGYSLNEHLKHQVRYTLEQTKITNVDSDASTFIRDQEGTFTVSSVGQSFIYDLRDNKFNPTAGYLLRLNQDIAGLGGDDRFLRQEVQSEYYIPVAKKWTFATYGAAGNIFGLNQDVRINQRFFSGGQEVRGFANAGFGPRDVTTDDALGGNSYYAATAELRFPLGLPDDLGVTGAIFTDAGSAFDLDTSGLGIRDDSSLRASFGAGVAWSSPFGPIRIDFAKAFLKESYDETEIIRFNFGTRF
ncbi:MAG: outer membrane protein assembly factor BamA [Rickettsiales bacterium]|nr:outer membrane protein assembly factor BamA [Rickettsiales bacterium]